MAHRSLRIAPFGCLLALAAARTASAQATTGVGLADAVPYVEVVGSGQVKLPPDRATVMVGVETRAVSAAAASAANGKIQRAVLDTLRAIGFGDSAVRTPSFDVHPQLRYVKGRALRSGYVARLTMAVQLSSLDQIGTVLDAALARGATSAGDVEYSIGAIDSVRQVALAIAVANAHRQAATIAAALGTSLGPVVMTTTGDDHEAGRIYKLGMGAEGDAFGTGPSIKPAEITVEASVIARWRLFGR
jgi:uncharacterized protein